MSEVPFEANTILKERGGSFSSLMDGWVDVVCATCVGALMSLLNSASFPYAIIDEAAQIMEPACLIPMSKGAVQVTETPVQKDGHAFSQSLPASV
jgi:hypothetical protein